MSAASNTRLDAMEEENGLHYDTHEESIPFTETFERSAKNGSNKSSLEDTKNVYTNFCTRLKIDPIYRKNYILTVNIISAYFVLGWIVSQSGPAFLDMQIITNVTLERGSAFFTADAIGYLFGSLLTGFVYDWMEKKVFIIFITVFGLGLTTLVIPWCSIYEVMVFIMLVRGIMGGGLDTSANALLTRTWRNDGRMFMQVLHFGFALGGTVSPLAIAPFLLADSPLAMNSSDVMSFMNGSQSFNVNIAYETTTASGNTNLSTTNSGTSILYIGFSISAVLAFICAIPIFIIFLQDRLCRDQKSEDTKKKLATHEEHRHTEMTLTMKCIVLFVLMAIFVMEFPLEDTCMSFLSTFCVRQMKWTKVKGALITSTFWGAFAFGRLSGIVLVVVFAPVTIIFMFATLELVSFAGFFTSVWFDLEAGIWIFTTLLGISMSVIFPCVFTWTEESFLKVTGRISSLFLFGGCCGMSINPMLLGTMMEEYSDMWFIYLLSGQAVLLYIIFLIAHFLSRRILKPKQILQDATKGVGPDKKDEGDGSILPVDASELDVISA